MVIVLDFYMFKIVDPGTSTYIAGIVYGDGTADAMIPTDSNTYRSYIWPW